VYYPYHLIIITITHPSYDRTLYYGVLTTNPIKLTVYHYVQIDTTDSFNWISTLIFQGLFVFRKHFAIFYIYICFYKKLITAYLHSFDYKIIRSRRISFWKNVDIENYILHYILLCNNTLNLQCFINNERLNI